MALTAPSSTLTGQTIAASYDQVLFLDAAAGVTEATLKIVSGTAGKTALSISDEHVLIKGVDTNNAAGFEVQQTDGTSILKVAAGTPSVLVSGSGTKLYLSDAGGEYISGDGTNLTITSGADIILAGTAVNITADTIDLSDATKDVTLNAAVDALNFDSNTLSIDASNNRVGIGTAAPSAKLHIDNATDAFAMFVDSNYRENTRFHSTESNQGTRVIITNGDITSDAGWGFIVGDGGTNKMDIGVSDSGGGFSSVIMTLDSNSRISLSNNDSGTGNTIFGKTAGDTDGAGDYNVFIGELAGGAGTQTDAADDNTGVGYAALTANTTGDENVAIGRGALAANTTGYQNVAIGAYALTANDGHHYNVAIGREALKTSDGGSSNIAIGRTSLMLLTTGDNNVAIGFAAMDAADGAEHNNIAIGHEAGGSINHDDADNNVLIGKDAGKGGAAAFTQNVAIGGSAMDGTANEANEGCVAIGYQALRVAETEANGTVAIGLQAGESITSAARNVHIGYQAGSTITTSDDMVCIGYQAGKDASSTGSTAMDCVYIGSYAGENVDDGTKNVAVGIEAHRGETDDGNLSDYNVAIGYQAMVNINDGDENTCVGTYAGNNLRTGNNCTLIGYNADTDSTSRSNSIAIGKDVETKNANAYARLGDNTNYVELNFGSSGNNWANTSDIRIKKDIVDGDLGLEFINKLRTIKYRDKPTLDWPEELRSKIEDEDLKAEAKDDVMDGLISQEVKKVTDELGTTFSGWQGDEEELSSQKQMLQYDKFVVPLIKAVQELSAKVEELESKLK